MIGASIRPALGAAILAVSVPLFLSSAPARAQQPAPSAGQHEHDGFFMRFVLGPSVVLATTEVDGEELTADGVGGTLHVALGFNILPKLILYGEVFDDVTVNPTVAVGDDEMELEDAAFGVVGLGVGLAYYLPRNVYVSAAASLANLRADYRDESGDIQSSESDSGFGVNLVVGNEWWVGDDWALGGAIQLFLASVPDDEVDDAWAVAAVGAGLSITYD